MKRLGLFLFTLTLCLTFAHDSWSQNKVYTSVTNEIVEKILGGLELKFQKTDGKDNIAHYEFKRGELSFRLTNYGGSDLWIECHFKKTMKLEELNRWNTEAKFSRAVLLEQKDKTIVSLESQLDCLGTVTDAMIKQFVNRFDVDAKKFVKQQNK